MRTLKVKNPVCLLCGKELNSLYDDYGMVDGGIVDHLYAPFGSRHDGSVYQIALCDGCIDDLEKKKRISLAGDYLFGTVIDSHGNEAKLEYNND